MRNIIKYQMVILALLMFCIAVVAKTGPAKLWGASVAFLSGMRADWDEEATIACTETAVYAASRRGQIAAIDAATGKIKWKAKLKKAIPFGIAVDDNGVYLGLEDGTFRSYDPNDGKMRWSMDLKSAIVSPPSVWNGIVYFITGDNTFYAVDAQTGKWEWQYKRDPRKRMSILGLPRSIIDQQIVFFGTSDGLITALDALTGEILWGKRLSETRRRFEDVDSTPLILKSSIFIASYDGDVYSIDRESGNIVWKFDRGSIKPIAITKEGYVVVSGQDNYMHALNQLNGQYEWRFRCHEGKAAFTGAVVVGDKVIFGCSWGHVHIVNSADGEQVKRFRTWGGITCSPVSFGGRVFVLDGKGQVEAYSVE